MHIGYARVSTADQNMHLQEDALEKVGCQRVSTTGPAAPKMTGAACPKLWPTHGRADTLVVWKLVHQPNTTLSDDDLKRIRRHRPDHNRLGCAVQLGLLRYPGWPFRPADAVQQPVITYVADQLGVGPKQTLREVLRRIRTETKERREVLVFYAGVVGAITGLLGAVVSVLELG